MSRQNNTYTTTATASRHAAGHGTSSAFSSSANPDEDWTKISDLAERRRIQNRIAQRNYRKKLKRRLEDLERRAGSSSASPPQLHAELEQQQHHHHQHHQQQQPPQPQQHQQHHEPAPVDHAQQHHYKQKSKSRQQPLSPRLIPSQYTPPMSNDDDLMFSQGFGERDGSRTPPLFAYHTYPAPESVVYPSYPDSQRYQPMTNYEARNSYGHYMEPVPVTLPSMLQFHDSIKREEDTMTPYNMSYHGLPSIDHHHHGYDESPHTPPLCHSYEHSSTSSESGYQYPTTPLSMPSSPRLLEHS